jgi:phosphotriesterase-related protein
MTSIQTARGAKDTNDLGRVLMHEHVFVLSPEIMQNYPEEWGDEDARVNDAIERLSE